MIGFFDTDENEYYFLFILFVSYVLFKCLGSCIIGNVILKLKLSFNILT